jgi:hypothetical protein
MLLLLLLLPLNKSLLFASFALVSDSFFVLVVWYGKLADDLESSNPSPCQCMPRPPLPWVDPMCNKREGCIILVIIESAFKLNKSWLAVAA